jgi:hypothetical protein
LVIAGLPQSEQAADLTARGRTLVACPVTVSSDRAMRGSALGIAALTTVFFTALGSRLHTLLTAAG